jgi:hypothetical protein
MPDNGFPSFRVRCVKWVSTGKSGSLSTSSFFVLLNSDRREYANSLGRADAPLAAGSVQRAVNSSAIGGDPWQGFFDVRQSITKSVQRAVSAW